MQVRLHWQQASSHTHCRCACAQVTNVGSAGNVHGPWGNDVTEVSIEIALSAGTAFCEVSWRQWAIDSRDGETDRVLINDEEVWSMVISRPDQVANPSSLQAFHSAE